MLKNQTKIAIVYHLFINLDYNLSIDIVYPVFQNKYTYFTKEILMKNKLKVYTLTSLILSVVVGALRVLSLAISYDSSVGYFSSSFIVTVTRSLMIVSLVWLGSSLLFIPKDTINVRTDKQMASMCISIITGIVFFASGIFQILNGTTNLYILSGALMMISSTAFILKFTKLRKGTAWIEYFAIFSIILMIADMHFDYYTAMNSPHKILSQLALISGALVLLGDMRDSFSESQPRTEFAIGLIATFLCFVNAISSTFSFITRLTLEHSGFNVSLIVISITLGIYSFEKLAFGFYSKLPENPENE